jgi:hypothetical protein
MSFLSPKQATSTSTSTSSNVNNDLIKSDFGGTVSAGTGATNFLQSLLTGSGDTGAANAGYQNYLQNAGYAPAMTQLAKGITGQGAASGLLNSGITAKALQSRGADLNQQYYTNYLQQLSGLANQGLQAGGLIANTGQVSNSTSNSKGSAPSTLGSIASTVGGIASIFSDRRLKHTIKRVGEFADGLGIYLFSYLGSHQRFRGVMADEVAELRPWALGPKVAGYATVNYGAL